MSILQMPLLGISKIHSRLKKTFTKSAAGAVVGTAMLETISNLGNELTFLANSTEADFLAIGERLHSFYNSAGEISKTASSVAELMAGDELDAVAEGFRELIGRVELLEEESRKNALILQRLLDIVYDLQRRFNGFINIVRSLRVICVSTRIESSRLGDRDIGFNVLADEVGKLALEIEGKSSQFIVKTESLSDLVNSSLLKVSDLESTQHAQAGVILNRTMATLEPLTEKQRLSSVIAASISTRFGSISKKICEIVSSMQFHDITRQRMEHAKEALDSVAEGRQTTLEKSPESANAHEVNKNQRMGNIMQWLSLGGNGTKKDSDWSGKHLRLAIDICDLQIAQLKDAGGVVVSSVENIIGNLRGIADVVAEMVQETGEMAGAVDETGSSFLSELETGFSSVVSTFSSYIDADRELSLIMRTLGETLGDMSSFAGAIESIGEKIKLLALNAIVKAAHIGSEGLSLGVLAESIHHLSQETRGLTEKVSEALRSMTSESESLCGIVGEGDAVNRDELAGVGKAVETILANVRNVSNNIFSSLKRLEEEGLVLSSDILKTVDGITVHHKFKSIIEEVVSRLAEITAEWRPLYSADDQTADGEHMRVLEAAYTMQNEREIHRSLLASDAARGQPAPDPSALQKTSGAEPVGGDEKANEEVEEDLGDNVELF